MVVGYISRLFNDFYVIDLSWWLNLVKCLNFYRNKVLEIKKRGFSDKFYRILKFILY